jgi:hypothetical protein
MAVVFSQDEIDAFRTAMLANPGVLEMTIGDKSYRFADLKAMREHLAFMESNLEATELDVVVPRTRYAATTKGLA